MDIAARLGGDEFAVILNALKTPEDARAAVQRVKKSLSTTPMVREKRVPVLHSIGIAIFPIHASTGDALVECADMALYEAKEAGKNQLKFYQP